MMSRTTTPATLLLLPFMFLPFMFVAALLAPAVAAGGSFSLSAVDRKNITEHIESGIYGTVTSMLILHEGEPVYEFYAEGIGASTLHNTRSVTKTVTGMTVGHAVDSDLLDVDEPVLRFFGELMPLDNPDPRKDAITTEDLLTMSGPLECDDWNSFSRGNEERMYIVEDWPSFFWDLPIRGYPDWAPRTRSAPYERAFSYCTAGVQMLGEIVERASGTRFADYVTEHLFGPLGIETYRWAVNGEGQEHFGGGLELRTRDLARFGELQRNGGLHEGRRLLSRAWSEASVRPHTRVPDSPDEYGYLWWLPSYEVGGTAFRGAAMSGNGGNRVLVLGDFGITAVITKTDFNSPGMHATTDALIATEIVQRLSLPPVRGRAAGR
jgi:CubicO group peptidase (beta-lactamase class C family)